MLLKRTDHPAIGETSVYRRARQRPARHRHTQAGLLKKYACFAVNYGGVMRDFSVAGQSGNARGRGAFSWSTRSSDMPWATRAAASPPAAPTSNAYTSDFITAYHFECTENFYQNLDTLLEFVSPYFTAESVKKEQGIIGEEIGMTENDPSHAVYYGLMRCLYERCRVRDSIVGTVESIAR